MKSIKNTFDVHGFSLSRLILRIAFLSFMVFTFTYCTDEVDEIEDPDEVLDDEPEDEPEDELTENVSELFSKLSTGVDLASTLFGVSPETGLVITGIDSLLKHYSSDELKGMVRLTDPAGDSLAFDVDLDQNEGSMTVVPKEKLEESQTYKLEFAGEVTDVAGRVGSTLADTTYYSHEIVTGNWEVFYGEEEGIYFGVTCTGAETCYVVGTGGVIRKSTDGGDTWELLNSGTTEVLYDVQFADSEIGYAVGDHGTVLKTIDAGSTWIDVSVDGNYFIRAVSVSPGNPERLVVVGDPGNVYTSEDGGTSWTGYSTPTANFNRAALMTSDEQVWIGSDFGIVVNGKHNTDPDAFRLWNLNDEKQLVSDEYLFNALMFEGFESVNSSVLFAIGSNPYKRKGDKVWRCCTDLDGDGDADDTTFYYNADAEGFLDHDENNLADEFEYRIFKSENNGQDWTMKLTGEGALKGVSFASDMVGYFTGFKKNSEGKVVQTLHKTIDGGETYVSQVYPESGSSDDIGIGAFFKTVTLSEDKVIVVGYDRNTFTDSTVVKRAAIFISENGAGL